MATLGTAAYGYLTGQFYGPTGSGQHVATVEYRVDANHYITMNLLTDDSDPHDGYYGSATIGGLIDGSADIWGPTDQVVGAFSESPISTAWYFKMAVEEAGHGKRIRLYAGPDTLVPLPEVLDVTIFGLTGTGVWSDSFIPVVNPAFTEVAAASPVTPNPPKTEWESNKNVAVLDGAYARITVLNVDGSDRDIYSNGYDGDYKLVSLDLTEYFDPSSTLSQTNAGSFSFHTPFDRSTSQATIEAFLNTFPLGTPLEIERGWSSGEGASQTYDVVGMGFYFIREVSLDRETWILTISFHNIFGLLAETNYAKSQRLDIGNDAAGKTIGTLFTDVLESANPSIQMTSPDSFLDIDPALDSILMFNPIPIDKSANQIITYLVNICGGRWYLKTNGRMALVCTPNIAALDYSITRLHTFAPPTRETTTQPAIPHTVTLYGYEYSDNYPAVDELAAIPRFNGYGDTSDIVVEHGAANVDSRSVYQRAFGSPNVDTLVTPNPITHAYDFATHLPYDVWTGKTGDALIVKGIGRIKTNVNAASTVIGSAVENPLISYQMLANAVLSWAFPTYPLAYTFTMRDDPSLKCGTIVQLEVENEYLNVLLVEAKRTFNGAGRVTFKGLYVSDTGETAYPVEVSNATATWWDETSETSGATVDWDAVVGYESWPNVTIQYLVYDPDGALIATLDHPLSILTVEHLLAPGDKFEIALRVDNYVWPKVTATNVLFDNKRQSNRAAGEMLFFSGQARLVYGSNDIS